MAVEAAGAVAMVHYDTIILGAGIAGLACATRLLQANHNANRLLILEARDRIGGRIASVYVRGCRLDTGANWIHGTGDANRPNPLMDIVPGKRWRPVKGSVLFQAPNEEHHFTGRIPGIEGQCLREVSPNLPGHLTCPSKAFTNPESGSGLLIPARMSQLINSCAQNAISEMQDLAATLPGRAIQQISVLRALVGTKAFQASFEAVPKMYRRTLGAMFQGLESMEAAPLIAQTTEPARSESKPGFGLLEYAVDDFDGEQAFLQDGYIEIINELAKPLSENGAIALETVVERIDWAKNPIVIETSVGPFTAREVVCTIPLGVLKDIGKNSLFVPDLPADKQEAIESLGFGTLDKMFAVYSRPWWEEDPYRSSIKKGIIQMETRGKDDTPDMFLGFTSELSGISLGRNGSVSDDVYRLPMLNLQSLTGQPALSAFISCKTAAEVEGMKDEDISELFHRTLTQWFGMELPRPDAVHVTRWAQDPYSRGSYSHMIAGLSEVGHRKTLQDPMINEAGGVLRFAGEHCSQNHFAMVHGALEDGRRAADASLQHLRW